MRNRIFYMAASCLLLVMILWGHTLWKSRQQWLLGLEAAERNNWNEAVLYFQRAILWYAPLNIYVSRAAENLWRISEESERAGRRNEALNGFRTLRSSFYASRSIYLPGKNWIELCDLKIARLMSEQETSLITEKNKTREQRVKDRLDLLRSPVRPREPWAMAAVLGFAGWIIAAIGFIMKGIKPGGGLQNRHAVLWGALFFLFYLVWLVGMKVA